MALELGGFVVLLRTMPMISNKVKRNSPQVLINCPYHYKITGSTYSAYVEQAVH